MRVPECPREALHNSAEDGRQLQLFRQRGAHLIEELHLLRLALRGVEQGPVVPFAFPQRFLRPLLLGDVDDVHQHVGVEILFAGYIQLDVYRELFPGGGHRPRFPFGMSFPPRDGKDVALETGNRHRVIEVQGRVEGAEELFPAAHLIKPQSRIVDIDDADHAGRFPDELRMLLQVFLEVGYSSRLQGVQNRTQLRNVFLPEGHGGMLEDAPIARVPAGAPILP
jgi:hypothetical protein